MKANVKTGICEEKKFYIRKSFPPAVRRSNTPQIFWEWRHKFPYMRFTLNIKMSAVAQGIHSAAGCCEEDGILQGVSGHNPVYESPGKAVAAAGGILWRDLIGLCIKTFSRFLK